MFVTAPPDSERLLRAQPWFASLSGQQQAGLLSECHVLQGAKGACLLPAGEQVQGWYAVLSGLALLVSDSDQPAEGEGLASCQSAFLGVADGDWFGEGSALKEETRRYRVVALRDTRLLCLPLPAFRWLYQNHLPFCQHLTQHLNMRLGQAMATIEAGRIRSSEYRLAMYLNRLLWRGSRRVHLTQEELGLLIGLSRQTINRGLRQLCQRGIVDLELGRVTIRDQALLDAFLQEPASSAGNQLPCTLTSRA